MATANITVTAPLGPGKSAVATVFNGATELKYDFEREIFSLVDSNGKIHEFEFETIATITHTINGEVSTVTITT